MKKFTFILILCIPFFTHNTFSQSFTEDFNDGNAYGWLDATYYPDCIVDNNQLKVEVMDDSLAILVCPLGPVTDFTLEYKAKWASGTSNRVFGAMFRGFSFGQCIIYDWDMDQDLMISVFDYNQPTPVQDNYFLSDADEVADNLYHTYKIQVSGNGNNIQVTCWLDGTQKYTGTLNYDDQFSQGQIALFVYGDPGNIVYFDDISITYLNYTSKIEIDSKEQNDAIISNSMPNPFRDQITIEYSVNETSNIQINIYDNNGRMVNQLQNQEQQSGRYRINWDGTDANGKKLNSGKYYYQILSNNKETTKKIILLK